MKLPAWSFELLRDTDAPFERVQEKFLDGERYGAWHPRHARVSPQLVVNEPDRVEIEHWDNPVPGVEEWSRYVVNRRGGRVALLHTGKFKGLPVLLLMAYWQLKSARLWERFVETL
ncbi:MAG: hypothetical protein IPP78_09815 [Holophagaceae bacterium]|nr:hypothetical protein [Holophagaceae bacterium]